MAVVNLVTVISSLLLDAENPKLGLGLVVAVNTALLCHMHHIGKADRKLARAEHFIKKSFDRENNPSFFNSVNNIVQGGNMMYNAAAAEISSLYHSLS